MGDPELPHPSFAPVTVDFKAELPVSSVTYIFPECFTRSAAMQRSFEKPHRLLRYNLNSRLEVYAQNGKETDLSPIIFLCFQLHRKSCLATLLVRDRCPYSSPLPPFISKPSLLPQFQEVPEQRYTWVVLLEYLKLTQCHLQLVSLPSTP